MKKRLTIVLCLIICFCTLSGCSDDNKTVLSYGKYKLTKSEYTYFTATYKGLFLSTYNRGFDSEEFWDTEVQTENATVTYQEYIEDYIRDELSRLLISQKLFDECGLSLTEDEIASVDSEIDEIIKTDGEYGLDDELAKFGVDTDSLREIKLMQAKSDAAFSHLYEGEGEKVPSVAQVNDYIAEKYRAIGMIAIYTGIEPVLDEQGEYTYDDNGDVDYRTLSSAEKKTKQAIVDNLISSLENGATYDECSEFSEEDFSDYKYEVLMSASDVNSYGKDMITKALKMKPGDFDKTEADGVTYIMVCLDSPDYSTLTTPYDVSGIYSNCVTDMYFDYCKEIIEKDVKVNEDVLSEIDIRTISQNTAY